MRSFSVILCVHGPHWTTCALAPGLGREKESHRLSDLVLLPAGGRPPPTAWGRPSASVSWGQGAQRLLSLLPCGCSSCQCPSVSLAGWHVFSSSERVDFSVSASCDFLFPRAFSFQMAMARSVNHSSVTRFPDPRHPKEDSGITKQTKPLQLSCF